eukprot:TRINITY_DN57148_c0_g1_i1.p1 TRINITY_DN57148_c0_g1~~TRINITY_DN57148_c0_g1_i1.p1  ORF type:complete len:435 (+),score=62.17 TRINITY_DN57148_c0_g1_i1:28-1305(+)
MPSPPEYSSSDVPETSQRDLRLQKQHLLDAKWEAVTESRTLDTDDRKLATQLVIDHLSIDNKPVCLEKGSVYGAAVLFPQLGRSLGWPRRIIVLSLTVYVWVGINIFFQFYLLASIELQENQMNLFSSQMYLCNYGIGARGPGGTEISALRMYSFQAWSMRNFIRESLASVIPHKREQIMDSIDPGEYGAQSNVCRYICCFISVMQVMNEMTAIWETVRVLYWVPTAEDEAWCHIDHSQDASTGLDRLRIHIAGMPFRWKLINATLLVLPKFILWVLTMQAGTTFLMETAEIDSMIINSVAINFILDIDEMLFRNLMVASVKDLVEKCEEFIPADRQISNEFTFSKLGIAFLATARGRFATCAMLTTIMILMYYVSKCRWDPEQQMWVSRDMFLPTTADLQWLAFLMPVDHAEKPFWTNDKGYVN